MALLCRIAGHRRDGARAWYDNLDWRSRCARCGVEMIRVSDQEKWRLYDAVADHDPARVERRPGSHPVRHGLKGK